MEYLCYDEEGCCCVMHHHSLTLCQETRYVSLFFVLATTKNGFVEINLLVALVQNSTCAC